MGFFNVGPTELLVVMLVVLLVFGPDQLSQIAHKLGRAQRDIRRAMDSVNDEMLGDLKRPIDAAPGKPASTVSLPPAIPTETASSPQPAISEPSPAPPAPPDPRA